MNALTEIPAGRLNAVPPLPRARRKAIRLAAGEVPPKEATPGEPSDGGRFGSDALAFAAAVTPSTDLPSAVATMATGHSLRSAEPIESGRSGSAPRFLDAALDPLADDRAACAALFTHVAGEPPDAGLGTRGTPTTVARVDPTLTSAIRESWLRRQAWHRAEKALTLQAKAICRRLVGGDKTLAERLYKATTGKTDHDLKGTAFLAIAPLVAARDAIEAERLGIEKHIVKLGAQTPLAEFVKATHGVGMLSLAGVIGEAGDLGLYANPAKLWKRMGLAVMPDGQRQRRVGGVEAMDHGYSPKRRSLVWTIGDCFVKAGGPYREVYDARKAYEVARVDEEGKPFRPIVCHLRAKRYAEKRLLRDLWRHWRKENV